MNETTGDGTMEAPAKPSKRLDRIKKCLEYDKIFFDTVAAISIALAAVIVSVCQLRMSQIQTQIAEQSVLPHFVMTQHQMKSSPESSVYDEDRITVRNHGAVISDFDADYLVVFDVKLHSQDGHMSKKSKFFVNGYYGSQIWTADGKGLLVTIAGHGNNSRLAQLTWGLSDVAKKNNFYGEIQVQRFLHTTYTDLLGRFHSEYYFVPIIYGAARISEEEGSRIFQRESETPISEYLDFDKITPETLFSRMVSTSN